MKNSKDSKSDKKQKQLKVKRPPKNPVDDSLERLLERAMNPDKETKRK